MNNPAPKDIAREWHSRVPLVRQQIRCLRESALSIYKIAEKELNSPHGPQDNTYGRYLVSGMNLGFSLELGFKVFYMVFSKSGPPRGHRLLPLFEGLPQNKQDLISSSYHSAHIPPNFRVITLRTFPHPSDSSDNQPYYDIQSPEQLLKLCDQVFEKARYFHEKIGSDDWAIMECPHPQMYALSKILDKVFEKSRAREQPKRSLRAR